MTIRIEKVGDYTGLDAGGWWVIAHNILDGTSEGLEGPYATAARAELAAARIEADLRLERQAQLARNRRIA